MHGLPVIATKNGAPVEINQVRININLILQGKSYQAHFW